MLFQQVPLHPHINCDITGRLFGEKAACSANASAMCNGISCPCAGHSRQKHIWKLLSAAMTSASLGQGSSELMVSVQPVSKWLITGWSHKFSCLNVPYWRMGEEMSPPYSFRRTSQSTPLYSLVKGALVMTQFTLVLPPHVSLNYTLTDGFAVKAPHVSCSKCNGCFQALWIVLSGVQHWLVLFMPKWLTNCPFKLVWTLHHFYETFVVIYHKD